MERRELSDRTLACMEFCASDRPTVKDKIYNLLAYVRQCDVTVGEYSVMLQLIGGSLGAALNTAAFMHEAETVGNDRRGASIRAHVARDALEAHVERMGRIVNVQMPEPTKQAALVRGKGY